MEIRELTSLGYPGYSIREDGWIINPKGRLIGGNANGQVRLPLHLGQGSEWRAISWLLAKAFVPNPHGYPFVAYKDGNKDNLHYTNLEWVPVKRNPSTKRAKILDDLRSGITPEEIAKLHNTSIYYVRNVARQRLKELELMGKHL